MERTEIDGAVHSVRNGIEALLAWEDLQPSYSACLESALAHIDLLCIELGLDLQ